MTKRQHAKLIEKMGPFLEPREHETGAFAGNQSPPFKQVLLTVLTGFVYLFLTRRWVVTTDRNVYVMSGKPSKVVAKYPRASTSLSTGKKTMMMLPVTVGATTVWAPKIEQKAARELVGSSETSTE